MKHGMQIIGLPIISITDGKQLGKVKSLVTNATKGSIDFLIIEHDDWQISIRAVPFDRVIGIGGFAVTVESEYAIVNLNEIPFSNQLIDNKMKLHTHVLTRKGELIGEIVDLFADEETGRILGMQLQYGEKQVALPVEYILTYGKDMIIVNDDAMNNVLENFDQLKLRRNLVEQDGNRFYELDAALNRIEEDDEVARLKKKQISILNGKKLLKTIYSSNGQMLFNEGTILTPNDILQAQEDGAGTVVELSMNVEV